MEEEFLQNPDCWQTEMRVAQCHQEVILHALEDHMPLGQVVLLEVSLRASIEYLDVRPLEALKVLPLHNFLESLSDVKSVPLLRGAVGAILLSVGARHVDFFLCSR